MENFLIYLLKATVCISLLYFTYKLLFSEDTFFGLNRAILIIGTFCCFLLPLISFSSVETSFIQTPFVAVEKIIKSTEINDVMVADANQEDLVVPGRDNNKEKISWTLLLACIFWAGFVYNLIKVIRSIYGVHKLIRTYKGERCGKYTLILLSDNTSPFSWGNKIIMSKSDFIANHDEILTHESAHIYYRHTSDILFFEIINLFQWFNPFMRLLKRELKDIHEFQADRMVLDSGIDAIKYQLLLVKKAVGSSSYTIANSFNHSKIKKRITMMLKQKSRRWERIKPFLFIPAAAFVMYAFAEPDIQEALPQTQPEEKPLYVFPIKSATKVLKFGEQKTPNGNVINHLGVDVVPAGNDTIYAFSSGIVIKSEIQKRGYGNYVVIDHGNEMRSMYAHNSINLVNADDNVQAGQPIGIVGNTGRSTGKHLHFEIRVGDESVDPAGFLPKDSLQLR